MNEQPFQTSGRGDKNVCANLSERSGTQERAWNSAEILGFKEKTEKESELKRQRRLFSTGSI